MSIYSIGFYQEISKITVSLNYHTHRISSSEVLYIPSKKSSAQVGVRVNSVLTRNGCI